MSEKKSIFKKLFSKSNKDCCSVEFEEIKKDENNELKESKDSIYTTEKK